MARTVSAAELQGHNTDSNAWISINGKVFDVTKFADEHPGGKKILLKVAGKDASAEFAKFHSPATLAKYGPKLYVGDLEGAKGSGSKNPASAAAAASTTLVVSGPSTYGEDIAFCDPSWYQGYHSPYYNDSHKRLRAAIREFVDREITPFCHEWDEAKKIPRELYQKISSWLPAVIGPPWPVKYVGDNVGGGVIKAAEFDAFHELVIVDEICRCGSAGVLGALFAGLYIGLPPIMHFGAEHLRDKVAKACLSGEKMICLAITEPSAGSDVANLQSTAVKTADGKHYIVNGQKKWITNGVFADYFTVAVRTGAEGMGGVSLLLIERSMGGVTTKPMNCMGAWSSGTTYITFEDVKVPVENLIGKENEGFKYIMFNFNHERWGIIVQACRLARDCLEDSIKYAHKRKTFGKRLIDHPVIRMKIAHMARHVEATQNWLENITFQLSKMPHKMAMMKLGGPIALLKAQSTLTLELCAREAAQIFGGLSYTRGGQGERIERIYREVRGYAIPGGSEEIMLDLGVRESLKGAKL